MLALSAVTQSPTNGFSDCPAVVSVQESSSAEHVPAAQARKIQNPLPKVVVFTRIFLARGGLHKLLGAHVAAAPRAQILGQGPSCIRYPTIVGFGYIERGSGARVGCIW